MKKVTKVVITATAIAILASGLGYAICKNKNDNFNNYLSKINKYENDNILLCAHRGLSSMEVENSTNAISLASQENYIDYIEFDIRMTKDGKLVLSHNDILETVDHNYVNISDMTYDEVINTDFIYNANNITNYFWYDYETIMINNRNKNLNNQVYKVISLEEGIQSCGDKHILIDIKFNRNYQEITEELIKTIPNSKNIIFQSLDILGIKYLQEHSDFQCQALISNYEDLRYTKYFNRIGLNQYIIDYDLIKELINDNKKISIWTINNSSELDNVLNIVDEYYGKIMYITNYPDLILTRLSEKQYVKAYY